MCAIQVFLACVAAGLITQGPDIWNLDFLRPRLSISRLAKKFPTRITPRNLWFLKKVRGCFYESKIWCVLGIYIYVFESM